MAARPTETAVVILNDVVEADCARRVGAIWTTALGMQVVVAVSIQTDIPRRSSEVALVVATSTRVLLLGRLLVASILLLVLLLLLHLLLQLFFLFALITLVLPVGNSVLSFVSGESSSKCTNDGTSLAVASLAAQSVSTEGSSGTSS